MSADAIAQIETFVQETMAMVTNPDLKIAHDFKHVDRVRHWALKIADGEGYTAKPLIEATALLHDVGLAFVAERTHHAQAGADVAREYLTKQHHFSPDKIEQICTAIRLHTSPKPADRLSNLLRDADRMELFGAVGVMRALTSKYFKPEYDPANIKGETWGMSISQFETRFANGQGIGSTIMDQLNFQLSLYDDLFTYTAKQLAEPLHQYARAFMLQLEREIAGG